MPKVKAPFFSLGASGTLGGVVTFKTSHRGTVVCHIRGVRDARTPAQLLMRNYGRVAQGLYQRLDDDARLLWRSYHPNDDRTGYEEYLAIALNRLNNPRSEWHQPDIQPTFPHIDNAGIHPFTSRSGSTLLDISDAYLDSNIVGATWHNSDDESWQYLHFNGVDQHTYTQQSWDNVGHQPLFLIVVARLLAYNVYRSFASLQATTHTGPFINISSLNSRTSVRMYVKNEYDDIQIGANVDDWHTYVIGWWDDLARLWVDGHLVYEDARAGTDNEDGTKLALGAGLFNSTPEHWCHCDIAYAQWGEQKLAMIPGRIVAFD